MMPGFCFSAQHSIHRPQPRLRRASFVFSVPTNSAADQQANRIEARRGIEMTSRRGLASLAVATALTVAGCRSVSRTDTGAVNPPDPGGCFAQVWDAPGYRGAVDFLNGPVRLFNLERLPGGRSWRNRIRSVRVGKIARVTVWTDEQFTGRKWQLTNDAYERLPDTFDRQVESLEISCSKP